MVFVQVPFEPMKEPAGQAMANAAPAPDALTQVPLGPGCNPTEQKTELPEVPPGGGAQLVALAVVQAVPFVTAPCGAVQIGDPAFTPVMIVPVGQEAPTMLTAVLLETQPPLAMLEPAGQETPVVVCPPEV